MATNSTTKHSIGGVEFSTNTNNPTTNQPTQIRILCKKKPCPTTGSTSERSFLRFLEYKFVPILPHEYGGFTSRKIPKSPNLHPRLKNNLTSVDPNLRRVKKWFELGYQFYFKISASGLVVKSNVAIVGPRVRFTAGACWHCGRAV